MAQKPTRGRTKTEQTARPQEEQAPGLLRFATRGKTKRRSRIGARLRNYFLTGLIVVGPVGITVYGVLTFIELVDDWVKPLLPTKYLPETYLPFTVPGVGLIFSVTALMIVGALTANLFGRTIISYGEMMLDRMPVVRNVYRALKQIFETVLSQSSNTFQNVGLIEYPRKGLLAIVFISTDTTGEIKTKADDGEELVSVFLPTTPNPTSGFLLFVPRRDVVILDMSVEEAAKLVISAGLVVPDHQARLKELKKKPPRRRRRTKAVPKAEPKPVPEAEPA